jgi:hypothetical protein
MFQCFNFQVAFFVPDSFVTCHDKEEEENEEKE